MSKFVYQQLNIVQWPLKVSQLPRGSALVGGSIRDVLLERCGNRFDLDFVVPNHSIKLVRSLAQELGGTCVVLDKERDIARLVIDGWTVDISSQVGESLEEDLFNRDFRVNAIALTLGNPPQIIDPTGGIADIREKLLVAVSEQNLIDDPLRLLRAIRLMAELRLSLDSQTKKWLEINSILLSKAAPERIQCELRRLADAPWADDVIPLLREIGLLKLWQQSNENLMLQSANSVFLDLLNQEELSIYLPLARLSYLLSDEGLKRLRFSKNFQQRCKTLRRWQKRNDGVAFESLKEGDRLQLHIDLEAYLPALILVLSPAQQVDWIQRWRDVNDPLFHPRPPVDGHILKEHLGLSAGPEMGQLLRFLCHERAFGRLQKPEQVLPVARDWWQRKQTLL